MFGGAALYLVGCAAFGLRLAGVVSTAKLVGAAVLVLLLAIGGGLSGTATLALAALVLAAVCAVETLRPAATAPV